MPLLSPAQKAQLLKVYTKQPLPQLLKYVQSGDITLEEMPDLPAEKRQYIQEQIDKMPNPVEQKQWQDIANLGSPTDVEAMRKLKAMLGSYIAAWEGKNPTGNHLAEARQRMQTVETALREKMEAIEAEAFLQVDMSDRNSMLDYLRRYPDTIHRGDIDDGYWLTVQKDNINDINEYNTLFPNGRHKRDADMLLRAVADWQEVKMSGDIFILRDYIVNNPTSPFKAEALQERARLIQEELVKMKDEKTYGRYELDRLRTLLNDNVITSDILIREGIVTTNVLETIRDTDIKRDLPDIADAIDKSTAECKEGYTDVYFFGIPSTGKTCVLMGLSCSDALTINLASGGGNYAAALQQYTDVGITVPSTPGTFVTTLEATVAAGGNEDATHNINLVEMSGEEFSQRIARNEENVFDFETMGTGVTELLKNNNRKVFFLIIDPTVNRIRVTREISDGYDEQTGRKLSHIESYVVNQRELITRMVCLLNHESNAEVMKKVDSIHFIMTKADLLGNDFERTAKAQEIFNSIYRQSNLDMLVRLSKRYNINTQTNFIPKLYTFSLGTFYVGGIYEYENADSNRLVAAIRNSTQRVKELSLWDKIKNAIN